MNAICRTLVTISIAAVVSEFTAATPNSGNGRTPDGQVTLVSQPTPQEQVRQLEEQRRNRLRMRGELNKSLNEATESLRKASDDFVDQFLDSLPVKGEAQINIVRKVYEAKQAFDQGKIEKAQGLLVEASTIAVKEATLGVAKAAGETAIEPLSLGVDLSMDLPALINMGENVWSWARARREIQRQIDRNDEALASIDKELPGARGRARSAKADTPLADDDHPPPPPPRTGRDDWEEFDKAIELLRQFDLAALNGLEKTRTTPDGQTIVDDEATLRAIEEEQQREREAIDAERRRNLDARDDATKSLGKFKLSIPPGWVPCTCPDKHPGAGIFMNGVQYHTPLLHCDG